MITNNIDFKLYQKIQNRIDSTHCHKKLAILAINIHRYVKLEKVHCDFFKLGNLAAIKSEKQRIRQKCPLPINETLLEAIAFETFLNVSAIADKAPNLRVIHFQLEKIGYAKTFAKQVSNQVASDPSLQHIKSLDEVIARHFVYQYGKHLVSPSVYAQVHRLFEDKPQILFPSSVALAA